MANIHVNGSGNPNLNVNGKTSMPKYVGARAVVDRTEGGVRITLSDYKGTTQEIIAEAIQNIISNADGSLTFVLPDGRTFTTVSLKGPQGEQGIQGEQGPAGSEGIPGSDGIGIASISKTATSGLVDTYTITYSDGTTSTYTVTNGQDGADGEDGQDGASGQDGFSPTASVVKVGDTATITITDKNGTTTASISDGSSAGAEEVFIATYNVTSYADISDAYEDGKIIFLKSNSTYIPLYQVGEIDGAYVFNFYALGSSSSTTRYWRSQDGWGSATATQFVTTSREVNGKALSSDITLTASDVGALSDSTVIPTKVSDLNNDSGFITAADIPQEIFYAVNYTSTYQEVATAIEAGKYVVLLAGGFIPVATYDDYAEEITFLSAVDAAGYALKAVLKRSGWTNITIRFVALNSSGKIDSSYLPTYNGGVS